MCIQLQKIHTESYNVKSWLSVIILLYCFYIICSLKYIFQGSNFALILIKCIVNLIYGIILVGSVMEKRIRE